MQKYNLSAYQHKSPKILRRNISKNGYKNVYMLYFPHVPNNVILKCFMRNLLISKNRHRIVQYKQGN